MTLGGIHGTGVNDEYRVVMILVQGEDHMQVSSIAALPENLELVSADPARPRPLGMVDHIFRLNRLNTMPGNVVHVPRDPSVCSAHLSDSTPVAVEQQRERHGDGVGDPPQRPDPLQGVRVPRHRHEQSQRRRRTATASWRCCDSLSAVVVTSYRAGGNARAVLNGTAI